MTASPARRPSLNLQQLVNDRRHELGGKRGPLSLRELTKRAGGSPSPENWRRISNGGHAGAFSDVIAHGIARALEVPVADVYAAAGLPPALERWVLPDRFDRVPVRDRARFEQILDAYLEAWERGRREGASGP